MFDALVNGRIDSCGVDFDVEYHDIEELNIAALKGGAHVSKISCAIYPHISQRYEICDSGAALGRGNGPLLVRRIADKSPLRRVAVPGKYTTANALIERLFPQIEERVPMLFSDIAQSVERGEVDGGVLIHEGRFVYHKRNLELVADLGLLWEQRTSLPLPLGAIVVRRDVDISTQRLFGELLRRSVEYAFANPNESREYIKSHAQELDDNVIDSHIKLFVNDYSLSLGDEGRAALDQLFG